MIWFWLLGLLGVLAIVVLAIWIWCWISWHWTNPDDPK